MNGGLASLHLQAWLIAALIALHALAASRGPARLDLDLAGPDDAAAASVASCSGADPDNGYLSQLTAMLVRTSGGEGAGLPDGGC